MKNTVTVSLVAICLAATGAYAQRPQGDGQPPISSREDAFDSSPVNRATDPNIEFFVNDWKKSPPRALYGKLVFRDMLTRLEGPDPQHPTRKPRTILEVIDNRFRPQVTNARVNKEHPLISKADGLSKYRAVTQVEMNPMTMSRAYSDGPGVEEICIATEGEIDMLFGKELRKLPVSTAYGVPSTGITTHPNINASGKLARFMYMVK